MAQKNQTLFTGIILIVIATVFILGGLGFINYGEPIISTQLDVLIAFIAVSLGLWYVFQGSN
jgi:hypothetical protein